jgi:hypothetical protein
MFFPNLMMFLDQEAFIMGYLTMIKYRDYVISDDKMTDE